MHSISYTNEQYGSGVARVISTHNVFAFVQSTMGPTDAQSSLDKLHAAFTTSPPFSTHSAEHLLGTHGGRLDIAMLSHKDQMLTLATQGSGIIYLKRAGKLFELVADGNSAQGPPERGDEYILTTHEFLDLIGGLEGLSYYFLHYTSPEVVEMMKTYENQTATCGFAAIQYGTKHPATAPPVPPQSVVTEEELPDKDLSVASDEYHTDVVPETSPPTTPLDQPIKESSVFLLRGLRHFTRRKLWLVPLGFFGLLACIVLVVRGVTTANKASTNRTDPITTIQTRVRDKLREADTEAFVNISGIESTLEAARSIIDDISKDDKQKYAREISQLLKEIEEKERLVTRIADTPVEEYFDLHMIAEDASVTDTDFDGTNFYLLDSKKGSVYIVGSTERAHKVYASDKYKGASHIAATGRYIYVLTAKDGVYLVEEERSTQVIKPDPEWGKVADMRAYTGNLYILDGKKKNIVKYPGVDEETFGTATPYLIPELQGSVQTNESMAIDGSIYTANTGGITKYTTGKKADFKLIVPHRTVEIHAVYASPDLDTMYVFDRAHKALYVVNKEGVFDRQWIVDAPVIAVAADETGKRIFAVTSNTIFEMEDRRSAQL